MIQRRNILKGMAVAPVVAAPFVARAETNVQWQMATSWGLNAPGPGESAMRIAKRVAELTQNQFMIKVFGAGELVPAFEVFDAVSQGTVACGHSASFFYRGKHPATAFFTTVPMGMDPSASTAWMMAGDGYDLWRELYAPFNLHPLLAGNSGGNMGGWMKEPIRSLGDLKGRKIRAAGLSGELFTRLGAVSVAIPPGEIFTVLKTGAIDGVEFLGPYADRALGFHKGANYYYGPGFMKPNGFAELTINQNSWAALPKAFQSALTTAAHEETMRGLSEATWRNAHALEELKKDGVNVKNFPIEVIALAQTYALDIITEIGNYDKLSAKIFASYEKAKTTISEWHGTHS